MLYEKIMSFNQKIYNTKLVMLPLFMMAAFIFMLSFFVVLISAFYFVGILQERGANIFTLCIISFAYFIPIFITLDKVLSIMRNIFDYIRANFFGKKLSRYEVMTMKYKRENNQE